MEPQLGLFETAKEDPKVEQLVNFLNGRGWLTAKQIAAHTGYNDRAIRSIASATPKILSYPGSPGYKLTRQATSEEIDSAVMLKTQGQTMIARYVAILNEHRFGTPTKQSELIAGQSAYASGK